MTKSSVIGAYCLATVRSLYFVLSIEVSCRDCVPDDDDDDDYVCACVCKFSNE